MDYDAVLWIENLPVISPLRGGMDARRVNMRRIEFL